MFQEFPYTNFHQLNLDWIVKIAKDFLDQYTHIQEVIQTGLDDLAESRETGLEELDQKRLDSLAELNQKTLDGLADLQDKYDTLNGLLQDWYDTHSADIAGQLADAIADFNAAAEAKSQALLDSWPADYSELVTEYNNLKSAVNELQIGNMIPNIKLKHEGIAPEDTSEANIVETTLFAHAGVGIWVVNIGTEQCYVFVKGRTNPNVQLSPGQWKYLIPQTNGILCMSFVSGSYTPGNQIGIEIIGDLSNIGKMLNSISKETVQAILSEVKNGALNINGDGGVSTNVTYVYTPSYITAVTKCINTHSQKWGALCYDSNYNFLRYTCALKQGDNSRLYLGPDVSYIRINGYRTETSGNYVLVDFTDYIFDFSYDPVDYWYYEGSQLDTFKAKLYTFDYGCYNVPFYGAQNLTIATSNTRVVRTAGLETVAYSETQTLSSVTFTIPYVNISTGQIIPARIGKAFKPISICCYGTSITDLTTAGKYPLPLQGLLSQEPLTVKAIGGGRYATNIKNLIVSDENTYDIILMEGCVNDWWFGNSIDDIRDAFEEIAENITGRCSYAFFVIDYNGRNYEGYDESAKHTVNGFTSREYYIKCAEIMSSYGIKIIDAGMESGINEFKSQFYVDQIHQTIAGGLVFAKAIARNLIESGILAVLGADNDNFIFDTTQNPTKILI